MRWAEGGSQGDVDLGNIERHGKRPEQLNHCSSSGRTSCAIPLAWMLSKPGGSKPGGTQQMLLLTSSQTLPGPAPGPARPACCRWTGCAACSQSAAPAGEQWLGNQLATVWAVVPAVLVQPLHPKHSWQPQRCCLPEWLSLTCCRSPPSCTVQCCQEGRLCNPHLHCHHFDG